MSFASATNGVIGGKDFSTNYYTTDGGTSWTQSAAATDVPTTISYTRSDNYGVYMSSNNIAYTTGWGSLVGSQPTIFLKSTDGGKTWKYMAQQDANKTYYNNQDLYFKDDNTGIAVGGSSTLGGWIYKTTDGGVNWLPQPLISSIPFSEISAAGNAIYLLAGNGNIFKTTDMGATLTCLTVNSGALGTISFPSSNVGYTGGITNGTFLKTTDGGTTWKTKFLLFPPSASKAYRTIGPTQFFFITENVGYCANRSSIISKTTDGGDTWTAINDDPLTTHVFNNLFFIDQNTGWVVGRWAGSSPNYNYGILKITNGSTVTYQDTAKAGELLSVSFADASNGVAVGKGGNILYTTNGGTTWTKATSPVTYNLNDVKFINSLTVLAVGDTSAIIQSTDGGKTWSPPTLASQSIPVPKYNFNAIAVKQSSIAYVSGYFKPTSNIRGTMLRLAFSGNTISLTDVTDTVLFENNLTAITSAPNGDIWTVATNNSLIYSSRKTNSVNSPVDGLKGYVLNQNYPNPFNPSTSIEWNMPVTGNVEIKVYDILGKEVKTLIDNKLESGNHKIMWDGRNNFGTSVSSGMYYYKIKVNNFVSIKKMMYLR
jgi:photosystem II stability/assembly factor-like uncharacterized protein